MTQDQVQSIYDFEVINGAGEPVALAAYRGKWVLIVNTASECGFTPQYQGLQELSDRFGEEVVVLAFPCNQFGAQEPGENDAIQSFCQVNYGIKFPVMGKVQVNGADAEPLFDYLKTQAPGILGSTTIKWNFTKFLVNRDGIPVKRFAPTDKPSSIAKDIAKRL